ncbi:MAG TPA: PadR family transcriptional regulator [Actinomycetota bacterium]|nr:PadR family transcriptional regulator [Actinomycetota bacterium]
MGRVFRRGELKEAIVLVLASLGEAHGYAIMTELKDRVGGGWRPSPGAIYPALLGLVETGRVRAVDRGGTRIYSLTATGRRAAESASSASRWASLTARAERGERRVAVGSLLDRFAADSALRRRLARPAQQQQIASILERAGAEIERSLEREEGESDG